MNHPRLLLSRLEDQRPEMSLPLTRGIFSPAPTPGASVSSAWQVVGGGVECLPFKICGGFVEPRTPRVVRGEDGIPRLHREFPQGRNAVLSLLQEHRVEPHTGVSVTSSVNSLRGGALYEPELPSLQATESSLQQPRRKGEVWGDDASGGISCTHRKSIGAARPQDS